MILKKNKLLIVIIITFLISINLFAAEADPDDEPVQTGQNQTQNTDTNAVSAQQNEQQFQIPDKILKLKGDFFSDLSMGLHKPNEFYRKSARVRFELEARYLSVQFYSQIEVSYDSLRSYSTLDGVVQSDFNKYFRLREAWAQYESTANRNWFNRIAIKLGRVIYSWGKGDEYRPSDIINPQDYTNFTFTELNERKIPVWSSNIDLKLHENWGFNFIFIPVQSNSEIPNENSVWCNPNLKNLLLKLSLAGTPNLNFTNQETKLSNSTYALKTQFKLLDVDFSIGYFSGYDTKPNINIIAPPNAYLDYKHIKMLCFDFEFTLAGLGFRGEIAYYNNGKYFLQSTPTVMPYISIERKFIGAVFGFDKNDLFIKGFYINLQIFGEFIINHKDNNIIAKNNVFGITWSVYYEILKWKFEIGGIWGLTNKELMLKPKITWKVQNDFNIVFGLVLLFGKSSQEYSQSPVGVYYNRDFVYLQANYTF